MMSNNFSTIQNDLIDAPLISVILPVYNGEAYLAEAIDSILAQTFKNFELIMIDDGSTDSSLAILTQYQARDSRIRVVSRENRNLVATLNESIDLARGEWVARMDQDDISLPHRFERQIHQLEHTEADICGSWVKYFGGSNRHTWQAYESDQAIKMDMLFKSPFAHPSVMMRTHLLKKLRYDKNCEKAEDYDLWVRAALAGWNMTNVPEVLLMYRTHAFQITSKSSLEQQKVSKQIKSRYWSSMTESLGLNPDCSQQALNLIVFNTNPAPSLDMANLTFGRLMELSNAEARQALADNISLLYLKVACNYSDIRQRWNDLSEQFTSEGVFGMGFKLWIITFVKIQNGSKKFILLKRMYNFIFK